MPITPTSTLSKNYQALGIDEIANDIETVFNAVNALPAAPTTTVVNISSAQILAMGSTPVELLPAPGVGKYYDINWDNTYLEFSKGATPYTIGTIESVRFDFSDGYSSNFITGDFLTETNNISIPLRPSLIYNITGAKLIQGYVNLNTSLNLTSYDSSNNPEDPTLGNGTLRAIITYTTRTFGA